MGICYSCKKEIILKENETNCPNCGKPPYYCNGCGGDITGETKECPICYYYICPNCDGHGSDCRLQELLEATKDMNKKETIEFVYLSKDGLVRQSCHNNVGISYAKNKLKTMVLKLQGDNIKNKEDHIAFKIRFNKITDYDEGKTWLISEVKEPGIHGIEWREVSNLSVCMGLAKKEIKKSIVVKGRKYEIFTRVDREKCEYSNWENLIIKYCPICKKQFPINIELCNNFSCYDSKGENKGQPRKLKTKRTKIEFCNKPRKTFTHKGV